jgi:thiol-disulfide isomerase/thioredoxin
MYKFLSIILLISLLPGYVTKRDTQDTEVTTKEPIKALTKITSEDELKQHKYAIVKFQAKWCNACTASEPSFQDLASKFPDVAFLTLDIDEAKDMHTKYPVNGVPSFVIFKDGTHITTLLGFNKKKLVEEIKQLIGEPSEEEAIVKEIKDKQELDAEISKNGKTIIRFYGEWCGYCKMIEPDYKKLAKKYGKNVKFIDVEISNKQDIAREHHVNGVPAFEAFKGGKKVNDMSGANTQKLEQIVKELASE